jgi:hypothetical protein
MTEIRLLVAASLAKHVLVLLDTNFGGTVLTAR